ncbi:MAG: LPXTG cell wall anchor domain-containing protein [Terriglobia bacterium]
MKRITQPLGLGLMILLMVSLMWAQQTTTTTTSGAAQTQTEVTKGRVVYVSGNDLVVKLQDGTVKHFNVPPGATFNIDGKDIAVKDLKPGTLLTRTITTTSTPKVVKTVKKFSGKVVNVSAPQYVTLSLPGNKVKRFKVPDGTNFDIGGQKATVFDLKPGMVVNVTVVTDSPETVVTSQRKVTGMAPATTAAVAPAAPKPIAAPSTPPIEGVLLIEEEVVEVPAPPSAPKALPKTGTSLPLLGLFGLLSLAAGFGLRAYRSSER